MESVSKDAVISPDGLYRYTLTRDWESACCAGCVMFVMFNPSTADGSQDDPTIRRCIGFAQRWGYGRMIVVNLFAVRSSDPKTVARMPMAAAEGPSNDSWIVNAASEAQEVICAWGCAQHHPRIGERIRNVMALIQSHTPKMPLQCLGYRNDGHPRHPLMLRADTERETFAWGKLLTTPTEKSEER